MHINHSSPQWTARVYQYDNFRFRPATHSVLDIMHVLFQVCMCVCACYVIVLWCICMSVYHNVCLSICVYVCVCVCVCRAL
jgi:hypothetical protein